MRVHAQETYKDAGGPALDVEEVGWEDGVPCHCLVS
jgi:hypothetical protein